MDVNCFVEKQPYIFISYAHSDKKLVKSYIKELHKLNYNLWYDEHIQPLVEWDAELQKKVEEAACVLVFVSSESVISDWVKKELEVASEGKVKIIPIQISETKRIDELESIMGRIQCVNLTNNKPSNGIKTLEEFIPDETQIDPELFNIRYNDSAPDTTISIPEEIIILVQKSGKEKELRTDSGASYKKNEFGGYTIQYEENGKEYNFKDDSVEILKRDSEIDVKQHKFSVNGSARYPIKVIQYKSSKGKEPRSYFVYKVEKYNRLLKQSEFEMENSVLSNPAVNHIYEYLTKLASLSNLGANGDSEDEEDKKGILLSNYKKIDFLSEKASLASFLKAHEVRSILNKAYIPIYPFGCNESQYKAVQNALTSQISVIEGPPGTGKTQTILNIIANILMQGKTVLVVSNNNSATQNVQEKLANKKYDMDFLVASLGKVDNKTAFIDNQPCYPDSLSTWKPEEDLGKLFSDVSLTSAAIQKLFVAQRECALKKQEFAALELENRYFCIYHSEAVNYSENLKVKDGATSDTILNIIFKCRNSENAGKGITAWIRFVGSFIKGIGDFSFYKLEPSVVLDVLQAKYYKLRINELESEIKELESTIDSNKELQDIMTEKSLQILRNAIYRKYNDREERIKFSTDDLSENGSAVLEEYPIILSTTFSSVTSLTDKGEGQFYSKSPVMYDYVIMDEASQVDISTGALALSCARNAVIVGDTKQLPNIVEDEKKALEIFEGYQIDNGYNGTNSFLKSVKEVLPTVPKQLLREHYRCHPKIINFCNQKFYNDELIIMSKDNGEEDVLRVYETVAGQHARGTYNQREIDVITNEILPKVSSGKDSIGIITPYREQAERLNKITSDSIECDTVHKYQGREKDLIILSTVDDKRPFANQTDLINVAVSRAKRHLYVVASADAEKRNTTIGELIRYAIHNECKPVKSKVCSVFDYLYKQYYKEREEYLSGHEKVSKYDSENLAYVTILKVLEDQEYSGFNVLFEYPLIHLLGDVEDLSPEKKKYVSSPEAHVDFLIYSKVSKSPVLAIEIDGVAFHKKGTDQSKRDEMKNSILEHYEIPYLRLSTDGSREEDRIRKALADVLK